MKLYHVSSQKKSKLRLEPRIPKNFFTENGAENSTIPRVCLSDSVKGCLRGISMNLDGKTLHVYEANSNKDIHVPSIKEVPDSKITGEVWSLSPIDLKFKKTISVYQSDKSFKFKYKIGEKSHTAELWDWNYKEI